MATFFLISVVTAEVLLGLASLDQVLFGLFLGVWVGLCFHFFLRIPITRHIKSLLDGEYHLIGYRKILLTVAIIGLIDAGLISTIFFLRFENEHIENPSWFVTIDKMCS